jgi:hypothetical protein
VADSKAPAARKRVGDYNPDMETGETLDAIAGQNVTIASIAFDRRNGKNGRYTLSVITLADGKVYHTGSGTVADKLAGLFGLSGDSLAAELDAGAPTPIAASDVFPVDATFEKAASQSNRGQAYWTVS